MKKLLLIMLPLLAFAGRTWAADYVRIGGYELSNGGTFTNSNNSRIDSGSASLSSDGKTLTLDNMFLTTSNAHGIEIARDNLTIKVVNYCYMKVDGKYGIVIGAKNVTLTGGKFDIIAKDQTSIIMEEGSSLNISKMEYLTLSHIDKLNRWAIAGKGTNNYGDVTIESSNIRFFYCKDHIFGDLNSVTIFGAGTYLDIDGNGSKTNFDNVKKVTLGNGISVTPEGAYFSSSDKTFLNASGQAIKDHMEFEFKYVVKIDSDHFPDGTFRNFVHNNTSINPDLDDYLIQKEIDNIKTLDVSNKNISNLKGIEYFTELTSLSCNQTDITALDLRQNTKLKNLSVAYCLNLNSLNVTGCNALESVDVRATKLSALDLSGKSSLKTLNCASCSSLASINLANCSSLTALSVPGDYGYELKSINLTGCTAMKTIDCHNNSRLTSLDVSACTALTKLDCSECGLTELNVTNCTALETVNISHNHLVIVPEDFVDKPNLITLDASYNDEWDTVPLSQCPELKSLNIAYCNTTLITMSAPKMETLNCEGNPLKTVYLTNCPALTDIGNFPVSNLQMLLFENAGIQNLTIKQAKLAQIVVNKCPNIKTFTEEGNQYVSGTSIVVYSCPLLESISCKNNNANGVHLDNLPALKTLDCSGNVLWDTGLTFTNNQSSEGCPALEILNCSNNEIKGYNFAQFKNLKELNCSNNRINSLELTKMPNLQTVIADGNNLYNNGLNIVDCPNLTTLSYTKDMMVNLVLINTGLTSLKHNNSPLVTFVSKDNPALKTIDLSHNDIKSSAIVNCPVLETIDLSYNPLSQINLDGSNNALSALKSVNISNGGFVMVKITGCDHLKSVNCDINKDLSQIEFIDCPLLTDLVFAPVINFTLTNSGMKEFIIDESKYTGNDRKTVVTKLSNNKLLETVKWNNSTMVDISLIDNPVLKTIDVSNNNLGAMTLNACADDAELYCQNNQLEDTNVDNLMNNLPDKSEHSPAIYYLDKSNGTEDNTCTMAQLAVAAAKGWKLFYYNGQEWLPFLGSDYVPTAIDAPENPIVETDGASPLYNLQGQRVGDNYKGIVIVNGKKVRRK